ncbi:8979_t:CDS:1, partial [Funneliformis geosporum]
MPSIGIRPSIPRANSPFGYIPSNRTVLSRPTPLEPKDNILNISNNTTLTQDAMNFNTVEEIIPSPFNEMTIYQLCSW